ncbi:hypothetical protein M5K25_017439 [Dendrobium thyrsiflorum]|uniref:Uncharacterized protein n=1 Tax=Dendrobium thyrsiflorum TaxID=117978 RepID=A0ABD0UMP8_DENTH
MWVSGRILLADYNIKVIAIFVLHRGRETYYTGGYDPVVPPVAPPPDWIGMIDALIRLSMLLRQSFVPKSLLCSPQRPERETLFGALPFLSFACVSQGLLRLVHSEGDQLFEKLSPIRDKSPLGPSSHSLAQTAVEPEALRFLVICITSRVSHVQAKKKQKLAGSPSLGPFTLADAKQFSPVFLSPINFIWIGQELEPEPAPSPLIRRTRPKLNPSSPGLLPCSRPIPLLGSNPQPTFSIPLVIRPRPPDLSLCSHGTSKRRPQGIDLIPLVLAEFRTSWASGMEVPRSPHEGRTHALHRSKVKGSMLFYTLSVGESRYPPWLIIYMIASALPLDC